MRSLADFSRIYIINLADRADRKAEIGRQLMTVGLSFDSPNVQLFNAIKPDDAGGFESVGARGCFMSHLSVLRDAKNLDNVLIIEDDLDFVPTVKELLPKALDSLPHDWGMFYGGCVIDIPPGKDPLTRVPPSASLQAAHFVAFNGSVIPGLVDYLDAILMRPTGHVDGGPMHVDGAYSRFRCDYPNISVFAAIPELGYQRSSRSDIHLLKWFDRWPIVKDGAQSLRRLRTAARSRTIDRL